MSRVHTSPEGLRLKTEKPRGKSVTFSLLPEDPAAAVCVSRDEQSNDLSSGISPSELTSHLFYTSGVTAQVQIRVKLNRVFFPRYRLQARSLDCGFAG